MSARSTLTLSLLLLLSLACGGLPPLATTCDQDAVCPRGQVCITSGRRCAAPLTAGGACLRPAECAEALDCAAVGAVQACVSRVGEACRVGTSSAAPVCEADSACVGQTCLFLDRCSTAGAPCTEGRVCGRLDPRDPLRCLALPAEGERCAPELPCADPTATCASGIDAAARCVVAAGVEVCASSEGCPLGTVCRQTSPTAPRLCLAPAIPGEICDLDRDCDRGLACTSADAALPARCGVVVGSACDADVCVPGATCAEDGVCRPLAAPGDACVAHAQCRAVDGFQLRCLGRGAQGQPGTCAVPEAGVCRRDLPCEPGTSCGPSAADRWTCQYPRPRGAPCVAGVPGLCTAGLECIPSTSADGRAALACLVPAGGACAAFPDGCQTDLTCAPASSAAPSDLVCTEPGRPEAPCTLDRQCDTGLTCAVGTCRLADGNACVRDDACLPGRYCTAVSNTLGLCRFPGGVGEVCSRDVECRVTSGASCSVQLGQCRLNDGVVCSSDAQCLVGSACHQGQCVRRGRPGEACTADALCLSNLCASWDACLAGPQAPGARCGEPRDCASGRCIDLQCN